MNFRDPALLRRLSTRIRAESAGLPKKRLMEVCGSHTQAVERFGLRALLPENVALVSGPGCPVCVTPESDIGAAVWAADEGFIVTTYGDLARVPGPTGSLLEAKARGADVRTVYSIVEAGEIARGAGKKTVVHVAMGFETTAQTTAAFLHSPPPENFLVLNIHRWFLPAMRALLESGDTQIDGYICPGHVSTVVGSDAYLPLSETYGIPQVVSGFEPADILLSILMLVRMLKEGRGGVENEYSRVVRRGGNPAALKMMSSTFGVSDAVWRGLGNIKESGMPLRSEFARYDAARILKPRVPDSCGMPAGCLCADVLKGKVEPDVCPLFGKRCTPETPVGPCMVSVEGACHNALKYL
jgi:hydrogenase expression/formation protein HypD